jgi:uncharacterized protein involved in exopolysaccharide biosynthesis
MESQGKSKPQQKSQAPLESGAAIGQTKGSGPSSRPWPLILLEIWWQDRWSIAGLLLLGIAAWTGLLLVIPNQYRAESRVIVLPPRFLPEVRTEPLSVATANELLASATIIERVIETLKAARNAAVAAKALGQDPASWSEVRPELLASELQKLRGELFKASDEVTSDLAFVLPRLSPAELTHLVKLNESKLADLTVDDLQRNLKNSTSVDQRTAVDIKLSPLIKLTAMADDARLAQIIANVWALVFEQAYDSLSTTKTRRQYESILKQQQLSQIELQQAQEELVQFKQTHNLELYLRQIEQYSEDFRDLSRQLLNKQNALRSQAGQLKQFLLMSEALQHNGEWLGSISPYSYQPALLNDQNSTIPEAIRQLAIQTVRTRDQLQAAITEFDRFSEKFPVDLFESQRNQFRQEFIDGSGKLRAGLIRLQQLQEATESLSRRLRETSTAITLVTSPSPDAVAMIQSSAEASRSIPSFSREEINPLWSKLSEFIASTQAELDRTAAELASLEADIPLREIAYRNMQTTLTKAQLSAEVIRDNLDRWKRAHEELFAANVALTNDTFSTARNLALVEEDVRNLEAATSRTRTLIDELQNTYNTAAATQTLLESRQRAVQRRADLLFQKLQDAQTAVAEEISDVTVAARAVMPSRHFFPRRSLLLPALTLLTILVLLARSAWQNRERLVRL